MIASILLKIFSLVTSRKGSDSTRHRHFFRYGIELGAAIDGANRQNCRFTGMISLQNSLKSTQHLAGHYNGVNSRVRLRRMAAFTDQIDLKKSVEAMASFLQMPI